jgi:hypothetical protein
LISNLRGNVLAWASLLMGAAAICVHASAVAMQASCAGGALSTAVALWGEGTTHRAVATAVAVAMAGETLAAALAAADAAGYSSTDEGEALAELHAFLAACLACLAAEAAIAAGCVRVSTPPDAERGLAVGSRCACSEG